MTIYDGGSSTSPMMGRYCDVSIPPNHISSSKEILIHFETVMWGLPNDPFTTGFQMEYNPIGKQNCFCGDRYQILATLLDYKTKNGFNEFQKSIFLSICFDYCMYIIFCLSSRL